MCACRPSESRVGVDVNKSFATTVNVNTLSTNLHDDVIKSKHFPRFWPFVREIHRSPVNSPHKGQWRGALMFSLICVWIHDWVNNPEVGDLRRYRAHYDVTIMLIPHVIYYGNGISNISIRSCPQIRPDYAWTFKCIINSRTQHSHDDTCIKDKIYGLFLELL